MTERDTVIALAPPPEETRLRKSTLANRRVEFLFHCPGQFQHTEIPPMLFCSHKKLAVCLLPLQEGKWVEKLHHDSVSPLFSFYLKTFDARRWKEQPASVTDSKEMTAGELQPETIQLLHYTYNQKGLGRPHSFPVDKGQLQRGQRLSLHKELHGEDKGQQVQVAPAVVS